MSCTEWLSSDEILVKTLQNLRPDEFKEWDLSKNRSGSAVYEVEPRTAYSVLLEVDNVECYKNLTFLNHLQQKGFHHFHSSSNEGFRIIDHSEDTPYCPRSTITAHYTQTEVDCATSYYKAKKERQLIHYSLPKYHNVRLSHFTIPLCVMQINSTGSVEITGQKMGNGMALEVYETVNYQSAGFKGMLFRLNGSTSIPFTVTSRTNSLTLLIYKGDQYDIVYRRVKKNGCECPNKVIQLGTIPYNELSVGYPVEYCPGFDCTTNFVAKLAPKDGEITAIKLQFNDFNVPRSYVYLSVLSQGVEVMVFDSSSIHKIKSSYLVPANKASLRFHSLAQRPGRGYNVTVTAIYVKRVCLCPNITNQRLYFRVPRHCEYIDCVLEVKPSSGSRHDYNDLNVYDNSIAKPAVERLSLLPPLSSYLTSLSFRNTKKFNPSEYGRVWFHREKSEDVDLQESLIDVQFEYDRDGPCPRENFTATEEWTTLMPVYGWGYYWNVHCVFTVKSERDSAIEFTVRNVGRSHTTSIYVYDGFNKSSTLYSALLDYTSYHRKITRSTSNTVTFSLHIVRFVRQEGYIIKFRSVPSPDSKWIWIVFCATIFVLSVLIAVIFQFIKIRQRLRENQSLACENSNNDEVSQATTD
uniref:CUB domain-containing protein n=1 Tax=Bursaphelenchus xylophilus TaxID=6326 RepID=A0A1I7RKD9_BURXY